MLQAVTAGGLVILIYLYGAISSGSLQGMATRTDAVIALLFGTAIGMVSTLISKRSVSRAGRAAIDTPEYGMVPVYVGLLNKLVIVAGGFTLGLVALGLEPICIVSGYIASHCALLWAVRQAT